MNNSNEPNKLDLRTAKVELTFEQLRAQLRQDQLEAALAGRIAESAFYAVEVIALHDEYAQENALCA